jgi:hypothetical protein
VFKGQEGDGRGRSSFIGSAEGDAREARNPGEQELPARIKRSGSAKGDGLFGGRKPLERRCKAEQVLQGSAGAEEVLETGS